MARSRNNQTPKKNMSHKNTQKTTQNKDLEKANRDIHKNLNKEPSKRSCSKSRCSKHSQKAILLSFFPQFSKFSTIF